MTYGTPSLTCSYSLDGWITTNNATSCTLNGTIITLSYNYSNNITAGTTILLKINNINNPPTSPYKTSSSYYITTQDSNGNSIDSRTNCTIGDVLITNTTIGVFNSLGLPINSNYTLPIVSYNYSTYITFYVNDTVSFYYPSTVSNCIDTMTFTRGNIFQASNPTLGPSIRTYTLTSSNSNYSSVISHAFDCSIITPPSETPVVYKVLFLRNNLSYFMMSATYTAAATTLLNSSVGLALASN